MVAARREDERRPMLTEPGGNGRPARAGVQGMALGLMLLEDPPLQECLAALAERPGSPAELAHRLDLDEDVVFECCRTLADHGLAGPGD